MTAAPLPPPLNHKYQTHQLIFRRQLIKWKIHIYTNTYIHTHTHKHTHTLSQWQTDRQTDIQTKQVIFYFLRVPDLTGWICYGNQHHHHHQQQHFFFFSRTLPWSPLLSIAACHSVHSRSFLLAAENNGKVYYKVYCILLKCFSYIQ